VAGCCQHSNEPFGSENAGSFLNVLGTVGFSRRTAA
jgi:hypothetical protein